MILSSETSTKVFFEKAFKRTEISTVRKELLVEIAQKIAAEYKKDKKINLNFICTHNSRRSQLAQVWGFFAAQYFVLPTIYSFSGGTETTAFHRNTVKTLQKSGFTFNLVEFSHQNPKYLISYKETNTSIIAYSKLFDDAKNNSPFIAITTCDSADANCPYVSHAIHRFHLPFVDPKHADETDKKDEVYLQTNKQIAAEIYFLFDKIKRLLNF